MYNSTKLLYQIALTQIEGVGDIIAKNLIEVIGDEEAIFKSSKKELINIKGISNNLVTKILDPEVLRQAEKELEFITKNKIQTFFYTSSEYPYRLKECADSPILLYYKGNADLNSKKIISIVGTRKSTNYGNDFCKNFIQELSCGFSDVLIVSGLAYGIDIASHQASLQSKLPTVGVLAHGLDRIYPSVHRNTAMEMLNNGGLLTEFPSCTKPDKFNFVRRNRIVAGIADATIVVQTENKGGSLITADIANSYNRDVFAVPGRVNDLQSSGCNRLIEDNKAILLQSADRLIRHMQWDIALGDNKIQVNKQQSLFVDLNNDEQAIYELLVEHESLHTNSLAQLMNMPLSLLLPILLNMEIKNIISPLPGGLYSVANS